MVCFVKAIGRLVALICALVMMLSACTVIEFGSEPEISRLDDLKLRVSTQSDVLLALGQPRGEGAAEFNPQQGRPRDIWFYEYFRTANKDIDLSILIILFENGLYDGYWWFSSTEEWQWAQPMQVQQ